MKDLPSDGRGTYAITRWAEIAKGGGIAPRPADLERIIAPKRDRPYMREELREAIINYFQSCISLERDDATGEEVPVWKRAPTKTAFALALGISKQTLSDYINHGYGRSHGIPYQGGKKQLIDAEDFDLLKSGYQIIESFYESQLSLNKNNSGSIFWLLNSSRSEWLNDQKIDISAQQREVELPEKTAAEVAQKYYGDARFLPPPEGVYE